MKITRYSIEMDDRNEWWSAIPAPNGDWVKFADYDELTRRVMALEAICASAYQMAGVYDAPLRFMDALALHDEYLQMSPDQIIEKLLPVQLDPETQHATLTTRNAALAEALRWELMQQFLPGESANDRFERVAAEFYKETGMLAPGKDPGTQGPPYYERKERWDAWMDAGMARSRAALAKEPQP